MGAVLRYNVLWVLLLFSQSSIWAQIEDDTTHHIFQPDGSEFERPEPEAHSLQEFCSKGHIHGHFRNFFMATIHLGSLKDYWTNASGGTLAYESAVWRHIQFGIKGIFSYQTLSSDLLAPDSQAMQGAKWEVELYDVNRPEEKHDLDRLEELFLKYYFPKGGYVVAGKIDINQGPLFLRRDGRMKPFVYRGIWSRLPIKSHHILHLGWIEGVSPRGMTNWYTLSEAIGLTNQGIQPDGSQAHDHTHVPTRGIGVAGYESDQIPHFKLHVWNHWFDKMMYMSWVQADYHKENVFAGLQLVYQAPLSYQAKLAYKHRYMQAEERGKVINLQIGIKTGGFRLSMAFLHSLGAGRFLFPRELGREHFYVSQPRSWIDGLGNTYIGMLRLRYQGIEGNWQRLKADLRLSYTEVQEKGAYIWNKYRSPSFYQTTLRMNYGFPHAFNGLELMLLYLHKYSPDTLTAAETFYRSHFHHLNVVMNINF